ncbi:MAG: ATP-binding protein [Acidobacteriota bacterium]
MKRTAPLSAWSYWLSAQPIKRKLTAVVLITSTAALLIAGVGIILADLILYYGSLQRDLLTFAQIIADNSTGTLAFEVPESAQETLNALRAREHVESACLYRLDGSLLAAYFRLGTAKKCPPMQRERNLQGSLNGIIISQPVEKERRLGTLVLFYDLGELYQRAWLYGALVLGMLVISSMLAALLSSRLRAVITTPILELAESATTVSRTKDFSIRALPRSPDEVGTLVEAFNEMLASIQTRDGDLKKALDAQHAALNQLGEANSELQQTNADLARSNQDLERFAFIASHDLQEPLRMITTYSQLLVREYPAGAEGQQLTYIQRILGGTIRMRELLSDLLAYAEISAPSPRPLTAIVLKATLAKVVENLRVSLEESGAEITIEELPMVHADEGHLIPLFQNLIENAIKYRSEQRLRITIRASYNNDGELVFGVKDNGIGIEPESHQKVFAAFKRLHGKNIPGTGIGLAICQRIVDRYEGRIWVESQAGSGATFCFTLPAAIKAEQRLGAS